MARRAQRDDLDKSVNPKGLVDRTRILPIFQEQSIGAQRAGGTTVDFSQVEKLLVEMLQHHEVVINGSARKTSAATAKGKKDNRLRLRRGRKHKTPRFSITQLLSVLEAGLEHETLSIRFDYFAMHLQCIRILRAVRAKTHDYLVKKHGEAYLQGEHQLTWVVGWILNIAAMSGRAGRMLGIGKPGVITASKVLVDARGAMGEELRKARP